MWLPGRAARDRRGVRRFEAEFQIVGFLRRIDVELAIEEADSSGAARARSIVLKTSPRVFQSRSRGRSRRRRKSGIGNSVIRKFFSTNWMMISVSKWKSFDVSFERESAPAPWSNRGDSQSGTRESCVPSIRFWNAGQDLVADPFVERHSARASGPFVDHPRAKDRVGFTGEERRE